MTKQEEFIGYLPRHCPECGLERHFKVTHVEDDEEPGKTHNKYECVGCGRDGWK